MNRSIETQKLINEKTIQRYVFEKLNYGNKDILAEFFPKAILKTIHKKSIRVIIPNYPLKYTKIVNGQEVVSEHIADFRVIYSDNTYHNIEVEWTTSKFKSHGEEVYNKFYKDGKGFLIVFEDDSQTNPNINYISGAYVKKISAELFSYWFSFKAKFIVDETINHYVPNYRSRNYKNWLIYLPSSGANGGNSKLDYLEKGRSKGKWAFRYTNKGKIIRNILNIYGGDIVIFVWGLKMLNGTHQRRLSIDNDWYFTGIDICNVKKGYYCDFNDETFESEEWKSNRIVEEKKYMHYFNFDKKEFLYSSKGLEYVTSQPKYFYKDDNLRINDRHPNISGVVDKLNWSLNNQGAPIDISQEEYNGLLAQIGLFMNY